MEQPESCTDEIQPDLVYNLVKTLYGSKKAPQLLVAKTKSFLCAFGFSSYESCLRIMGAMITLNVDYLIIAGSSLEAVLSINFKLGDGFEMEDYGEANGRFGA